MSSEEEKGESREEERRILIAPVAVKMSAVNVTNVTVLDNPSMFTNPFQFEISYECLLPLQDGMYGFCFPLTFLPF